MPAISRNAHTVKEMVCDMAISLLNLEVGEDISFNFKDGEKIYRRIK